MPKVSIVMPVYNGATFLRDAIDGMLCQSLRDFEFIIVDDGSTDESADIISEYASVDDRIRPYTMAKNSGIVAALNAGVQDSSAKFVARMDADDISLPERLKKQVDFLEATNCGAVGTNYIKFGPARRKSKTTRLPLSSEEVQDALPYTCCIGHPTVMFRRSTFDEVGGYDAAYSKGGAEDYDLWLRMSMTVSLANLEDVLLRYRMHQSSLTALSKSNNGYTYNSASAVVNYFCLLYGLRGVKPTDGVDELVAAFERSYVSCDNKRHRTCLNRWALRLMRFCEIPETQRSQLTATFNQNSSLKERLKSVAYRLI